MSLNFRAPLILAACFLALPFDPGTDQHTGSRAGDRTIQNAITDVWLTGRAEIALLMNLRSFAISARVRDGRAILSGKVDAQIDRDLAGQIALDIDGIHSIDNQLEVAPTRKDDHHSGTQGRQQQP